MIKIYNYRKFIAILSYIVFNMLLIILAISIINFSSFTSLPGITIIVGLLSIIFLIGNVFMSDIIKKLDVPYYISEKYHVKKSSYYCLIGDIIYVKKGFFLFKTGWDYYKNFATKGSNLKEFISNKKNEYKNKKNKNSIEYIQV